MSKGISGPYSKIARTISENDLKNPAIGRMLPAQLDEFKEKIANLEEYREKFHTADKEASIFKEKLYASEKDTNGRQILGILGGVLLGVLPSLWKYQGYFWAAAILGCVF